jgi:hypothetical protein
MLCGALAIALLGLALAGPPETSAAPAPLPVVGAAEEALLLPWGLRLRARIDTGAAVSSVDARAIRVRGARGSRSVRFVLSGEGERQVALELPLAGYRRVATADGGAEKRPLIELELCFAGQRIRAEFTLNDRSRMEYPLLVGRNILAGRFLVDAGAQLLGSPVCPVSP